MVENTITIGGKKVNLTPEDVPIDDLKFYPENPRILPLLTNMPKDLALNEKQEWIEETMRNESSVKNLIPQIKRNGGLVSPIFVIRRTKEVIEGNSRLAAYRLLYKEKNDSKWSRIPCNIADKLSKQQISLYLSSLHIHGPTTWGAYEKAYFAYFMSKNQNIPIEEISISLSLSIGDVERIIKNISDMKKNEDNNKAHYSYYAEGLNSQKNSDILDKDGVLRSLLLDKIRNMDDLKGSDQYFTALELRDCLPKIWESKEILSRFKNGEISLREACRATPLRIPPPPEPEIPPSPPEPEKPPFPPRGGRGRPKLNALRRIKEACSSLKKIGRSDMDKLNKKEHNQIPSEFWKLEEAVKRLERIIKS